MKNIYSKSQENFKKALKCLEENDKNMINIIYKLEDKKYFVKVNITGNGKIDNVKDNSVESFIET